MLYRAGWVLALAVAGYYRFLAIGSRVGLVWIFGLMEGLMILGVLKGVVALLCLLFVLALFACGYVALTGAAWVALAADRVFDWVYEDFICG